ncbi:MAG: hypothetical protein HQ579_02200 [Candidatus Omnitrophica bacterium]|nr:hypothetical protein [Candidatus Omnitrophota bacterium]
MKRIHLILLLILPVISQGLFQEKAYGEERILTKAADYESMIPTKVLREIKLPENGYHEGLLLENGNIVINNGEGINSWVVDLKSGSLLKEIDPIATFTEGITHAPGGKYWVTDWNTKKLYLVKIVANKMVSESEISFAPSHPAGVIWTGKHLYLIIWTRGLGTKYHILKMDKNGAIIDRINITDINEPTQLAWDGRHLWITSWFKRRAYKIDIDNLEIKGYFRTNIEKTSGIVWDGKYFWITGTNANLRQIEILPSQEK